jgi:hypothetical protein
MFEWSVSFDDLMRAIVSMVALFGFACDMDRYWDARDAKRERVEAWSIPPLPRPWDFG